MLQNEFDLLIIGSGPAGENAALTAAELGKRAAIIDGRKKLGWGAIPGSTVPSKTLREAILYLSGFDQRPHFGGALADDGDQAYVRSRVQRVVERTSHLTRAQLAKKGIEVVDGLARFSDPHTLEVETNGRTRTLTGDHILIACGARAELDPTLPFDGKRVLNWSELQSLERFPRDVIIVGGGVIGMEYATMLATLKTKIEVVERQPAILDWLDRDIIEALVRHTENLGIVLHLGVTVASAEVHGDRVVAHLSNGRKVRGDILLYAAGRKGNADRINVEAAGLQPDAEGRLPVNQRQQTRVAHIYGAGDVIGFPALASTAMIQGRLAVLRMWGHKGHGKKGNIPYSVYTVPEISMVGLTEEQLREKELPYVVGVARYEELTKGQILGSTLGLLKLLFDPTSHKLLGVHAIGELAAELIHIGQAVLAHGGRVDYFRDNVFNHPTLTEAYRVAALDGLAKLPPSQQAR